MTGPNERRGRAAAPAAAGGGRFGSWAVGLLLCLVTTAAYWPVFHDGFVWDDDHFLTQNPLIRASDGLAQFWFSARATDYWPVTSSSLWMEWRWWGLNATGYHATNLLLHLVSVLLLWAGLRRLRVPGAAFAALLFAVHPVNVESVAWITQRKNLLALIFFLLALLGFMAAEGSDEAPTRPARLRSACWYGCSLLAFALAMLSKGSVAMLPVLLVAWIAGRRPLRWRDAGRVLPFFLIAGILTGVDIWFQRHGTDEIIRRAGGAERVLGAGTVAWFYLGKALLPVRLAFCYPQWPLHPGEITGWLPGIAALAVGAALFSFPAGRPLRLALGYFVLMLVPGMGLTDVYFMKYSLVADHYQQLALIGIVALAGFGWESWRRATAGRPPWGRALPYAAALLVVAGCGRLTWRQCGIYRDRETLFRAAIAANPGCWMAENNLGLDLVNGGRYAEALGHCQAAVRLHPEFSEAHNNLGIARAGLGQLPLAVEQFQAAIRLKPNYPQAYNNLGNTFRLAGKLPEALQAYARALALWPDYAEGHNNLGVALMDLGRLPEAIAQLRQALRIAPDYVAAQENLDLALRKATPAQP